MILNQLSFTISLSICALL